MTDFQPKPFGKYFLIEKLATGGMAEIYKAKTFGVDGFEKLLAIKRILPHCSSDKEFITMLIDEAKLSVALSHTNIAQVFDLGKVGTDYFISMEFVDGINLREVMNRCKENNEKIPEDIAVYAISEVCKGLDYAHAKKDMDGNPLNIVHRDISPQNILLSFEGEVKIVDFGIAKAAMNISHTMAGVLKGKITYMSPEQALGKPVDYKTDLFSTGLMLYELLTGQRFFSGETQFEVLKKIRTTRITEASFPDSIPPDLKRILAKSLAYSQRDRFENAGDMQIELTKYLYSTYLDFSPRKLANLVKRLFAEEIKNKSAKRKDDLSIDSQTRSIMLGTDDQQNLVHRDDIDKTSVDQGIHFTQSGMNTGITRASAVSSEVTGQHTQQSALEISQSKLVMPQPAPVAAKPSRTWAWVSLLVLFAFLGVGGYFVYKRMQPPQQGQKIGTIVVNSIPPGAKIFLNDKDTNLLTPSPLQAIELNIGQKITLKHEKFKDWDRLVTLISAQPLNIQATLDPIPSATIEVTTHPEGAKVILDGKDTGLVTPAKIADLDLNKTVTLKVEKEDFYPTEDRITLYSVEPVKYEKKLEPIKYGLVEVNTTPPGAKIFIDNQDTNLTTPNKLQKLEVGKTVTLRVEKDQYRGFTRSLQIQADKPIVITEKLVSEEEIKKKEEEDKKKQLEKQKAEQEKQAKILEEQKKKEELANKQQQNPTDNKKKEEEAKKLAEQKKLEEAQKNQQNSQQKKEEEAKKLEEQKKLEEAKKNNLANKTTPTAGGFGSLRIDSSPPGASVFIDGVSTGRKTPLVIRGVRVGKDHSVKLELEGYKGWSTSFSMDSDSKSLSASLKK
ncbi:MAG: serine/threonine-protein kinase [bacterium]